jgi:hypothetical protein
MKIINGVIEPFQIFVESAISLFLLSYPQKLKRSHNDSYNLQSPEPLLYLRKYNFFSFF